MMTSTTPSTATNPNSSHTAIPPIGTLPLHRADAVRADFPRMADMHRQRVVINVLPAFVLYLLEQHAAVMMRPRRAPMW